jgi:hypothetical protein
MEVFGFGQKVLIIYPLLPDIKQANVIQASTVITQLPAALKRLMSFIHQSKTDRAIRNPWFVGALFFIRWHKNPDNSTYYKRFSKEVKCDFPPRPEGRGFQVDIKGVLADEFSTSSLSSIFDFIKFAINTKIIPKPKKSVK